MSAYNRDKIIKNKVEKIQDFAYNNKLQCTQWADIIFVDCKTDKQRQKLAKLLLEK